MAHWVKKEAWSASVAAKSLPTLCDHGAFHSRCFAKVNRRVSAASNCHGHAMTHLESGEWDGGCCRHLARGGRKASLESTGLPYGAAVSSYPGHSTQQYCANYSCLRHYVNAGIKKKMTRTNLTAKLKNYSRIQTRRSCHWHSTVK